MERTLTRNEARIILDLEWNRQKTVSLEQLREKLGSSDNNARVFAHRLVKKGWLERLRPGLFQFIPADRGREGVADMNPLAAGSVLVSPYFYSFGTACTYHGLTEQVFSDINIACREHRRTETIRDRPYIFVHVPVHRFFGYESVSVLGYSVNMARIERVVLDVIDRPQHAGGIGEVSRIVSRAVTRISWDLLLEFTRSWELSALAQRLGYFIDLHRAEIPDHAREMLLMLIRPHSKIQLGSRRRWGTKGKLVRPWNVVENVPRDVLISRDEKPRQRVVLSKKEHER